MLEAKKIYQTMLVLGSFLVGGINADLLYAIGSEVEQKENAEDPSGERPSGNKLANWEYGKFRLKMSYAKPSFSNLEHYDKFYDTPSPFFGFGGDYTFWRKYIALGVGANVAYFIDDGHALQSQSGVSIDDLQADDNGTSELTLIPAQLFLTLQFSPFPVKYLSLGGWFGYESLMFSEARVVDLAEQDSADAEIPKSNVTKGTKNSVITGFALNILLNGLDESSVNSMRDSLGIGALYLSPFVEIITEMDKEDGKMNLDRKNIGVAFTFESIR